MFCTKCGNEISETDAFCPSCGAPIPEAQAAEENANPFAAATPEEPKKKGKIWIPIVAVIAAVALLAGIAYVYSAIIIPGKQREALLSTAEDTMNGISTGNVAEEDSY